MRDVNKFTAQIAVGLTAVGFLLLVLGWNGAASWDRVPSQMPYVISGGLAGVGLIAVGLTLVVVGELRRTTRELTAQLQHLAEATAPADAPRLAAVPAPEEGSVVAGRTTFHRPSCRLVAQRDDLQLITPATAHDRGLAPCRICDAAEARTA